MTQASLFSRLANQEGERGDPFGLFRGKESTSS